MATGEIERILEAVEGDLRVLPAEPPSFLYHDLTPRIVTTPKHQAYIKIAEGCDHPCTFCIIPQLRGQFRSRRFESVIAEAERLAQSPLAPYGPGQQARWVRRKEIVGLL